MSLVLRRARLTRPACALAGVAWILGSLSILTSDPRDVFQEVSWLGPLRFPWFAWTAMSVLAGLEAYLGVLLLIRPTGRGALASALVLGGLTLFLVARGLSQGWDLHCGCLAVIWRPGLVSAVARNVALVALLAAVIRPDRPSASGPSLS